MNLKTDQFDERPSNSGALGYSEWRTLHLLFSVIGCRENEINLQDAVRADEKDKSRATDGRKTTWWWSCESQELWEEFTNEKNGRESKYCKPGVWYVSTVAGKLISRQSYLRATCCLGAQKCQQTCLPTDTAKYIGSLSQVFSFYAKTELGPVPFVSNEKRVSFAEEIMELGIMQRGLQGCSSV